VQRQLGLPRKDLHEQANGEIQVCLDQLGLQRQYFVINKKLKTYMNGKMMMQSIEKIPWNNEGARHAQVEFHVPVPRVIPAARSAPTLYRS
jgi:hypothetical protein